MTDERTVIDEFGGAGIDPQVKLADERYEIIGDILCEVYEPGKEKWILSDMLDSVILDKYLGLPIFLLVMWAMFHFTFQISLVFMEMISQLFAWIGTLTAQIPIPWLAALLTDGVISGVGFILTFVPPIFFLYLAISILEDTGYLSRAAFVVDRIMVKMGLHGRSFIPLLLGFGCSVAAVMASRTVEGKSNRLTTLLVSPLMSCAGRLPAYIILAGVFFPDYAGTMVFFMYVLGILMAVIVALVFKNTLFREESSSLLMELSMYQMPTAHGSFRHMWDRGMVFIKHAGGYLLVGSIVMWFLSAFGLGGFGVPIDESYLGLIGHAIQPIFAPLGFGWEVVSALIFGFMAKEAIVQSLSVIYAVGSGITLESALLASITPASALALMVFILLYIPCIATVGAVKKETGSVKWTIFSVGYQLILAYGVAYLFFIIGGLFFV
ncbi:MAG: ferrous iron transport protein B [Candidatus Thorarchaeota archaeon]|nr:MAG: ferrous iron transport protein B [Candidatus Thorarchaeota archaeon]RLI58273.1 MAG: ferrous iron transport protein B [Candidatus Thorarchaeota archaeon]